MTDGPADRAPGDPASDHGFPDAARPGDGDSAAAAPTVRAVVLAAGRGARMRRGGGPELDAEQRRRADAGRKALIPFHGHPFLSHALTALADGGIREVCLVVGPGDDPVRRRYEREPTRRLRISFAVQPRPTGSAHALLAAESFATGGPVMVVNADNLYPAGAIDAVRRIEGEGLAVFRAGTLVRKGNVPPERVAAFALVEADERGRLRRLVEKPVSGDLGGFGADPLVSMTCWRFGSGIFRACREVGASSRGEHELTDAVAARLREGACPRVVEADGEVLDLTGRADIASVSERLRGRVVRL